MTIEQIIAVAIVFIQLIGVFFYIRAMVFGTTRPNRVTWFIWALAPLIATWLALKAGAGLSILPVFMAGFNPVLVLIASFLIKNGYWKITKLDIVCGFFALVSMFLWIITHSFSISIFFAILSDALAAIPTIIKSWKYPETETASAYLGGIIANALGLAIIKIWSFPIYFSGFYFIILNLILIIFIYRKKIIFWYTK
ncbi:MAG: hypothetical protein KGL67_02610 [Patescibacteria group bacterium]|nr:hypothetical protein [Patescibacteria group bacterium]